MQLKTFHEKAPKALSGIYTVSEHYVKIPAIAQAAMPRIWYTV